MDYWFLIALINCLFLRSARLLFNDTTAQMAAGNHPIRVICNSRQRMPDNIFPLNKKESQGNNTAIRIIIKTIMSYL